MRIWIAVLLAIFGLYLLILPGGSINIGDTITFGCALCFALHIIAQNNYIKKEIESFKLDDSTHSLSNKSRFGIQQAMFYVFLENPISGTGYGLQAFESRKKYPAWAKKNNWEFRVKYLNQNDKRFPPGYNMYLRILSETGLVGFLIFCGLLIQVFLWCYNNFNKHNLYSIVILISMTGFSMNWLKMDSLRIYGFWLCLAIIFALDSKKLKNA